MLPALLISWLKLAHGHRDAAFSNCTNIYHRLCVSTRSSLQNSTHSGRHGGSLPFFRSQRVEIGSIALPSEFCHLNSEHRVLADKQAVRYLRRFFFVRTLNLTIGRLAVEATRVLLRRRRRSHRASAEKK